jgi:hypothetical protein
MAKGYEIGLPSRVGPTEDGLCEEPRRVRMNKVASLVVDHHEVRVGIGLLNRHEFREMEQGKVGRDNTYETFVSIVERSAIGGNHPVDGQLQGVAFVEIRHPAWLIEVTRRLIPYLAEVVVFLFDNSCDGVSLANGVDLEVFSILWEHVWLGADRAAVDVRVELHDTPAIGKQGVGLEGTFYEPTIGIGSRLDG